MIRRLRIPIRYIHANVRCESSGSHVWHHRWMMPRQRLSVVRPVECWMETITSKEEKMRRIQLVKLHCESMKRESRAQQCPTSENRCRRWICNVSNPSPLPSDIACVRQFYTILRRVSVETPTIILWKPFNNKKRFTNNLHSLHWIRCDTFATICLLTFSPRWTRSRFDRIEA